MEHKTIEFWFDMGSNYSYIAMMRIEALAQTAGTRVVLKPFLLGPIFKSFGWDSSPFNLQKLKGEYMWRDMERQCAKYGIAWHKPSIFPRRALLPMRLAAIATDEPWLHSFCRLIMKRNFACDSDIDDAAVVQGVLDELGVPAAPWLAQAQSERAKLLLREQTERALERGIFGAPMFFVARDMYWGNDRLEDALSAINPLLD